MSAVYIRVRESRRQADCVPKWEARSRLRRAWERIIFKGQSDAKKSENGRLPEVEREGFN